MSLIASAVAAVQKGFTIFPVEPGGKTPGRLYPTRPAERAPWLIKWGEVATDSLPTVARWWTESPFANVGIACKPSGILVVDCDMPKRAYQMKGTRYEHLHERHGAMVTGVDVLESIVAEKGQSFDELYDTYRVATGSGGLHLYYQWPAALQASQASLVEGILDIRCNGGNRGGYVLGAGSETSKGMYCAENDLPLRQAPAWLMAECLERPRVVQPKEVLRQPGSANYSGLVTAVRFATEGNRNQTILWAARSMASDGADERDLEVLVQASSLPEREARQTALSGYRIQRQKEGL